MHTQQARNNVLQMDFLLAENSEKNIFLKPKRIIFSARQIREKYFLQSAKNLFFPAKNLFKFLIFLWRMQTTEVRNN